MSTLVFDLVEVFLSIVAAFGSLAAVIAAVIAACAAAAVAVAAAVAAFGPVVVASTIVGVARVSNLLKKGLSWVFASAVAVVVVVATSWVAAPDWRAVSSLQIWKQHYS